MNRAVAIWTQNGKVFESCLNGLGSLGKWPTMVDFAKITIESRIRARHQKFTGVACQVSIRTPHSVPLNLGKRGSRSRRT